MLTTVNFGETALHFGHENSLLVDLLDRHFDASDNLPPTLYPLLLSGPSGCGKSSLAFGIAKQWEDRTGNEAITTTVPDLARSLADAAKTDDVTRFSQTYRSAGLVVVDDIQMLASRDKGLAQQWLCSVVDFRCQHHRPTIVTTDTCVAKLKVGGRLRSRLVAGLSIPIELPHASTRRHMISDAATRLQLELGPTELEQLESHTAGKSAREILAVVAGLVSNGEHPQTAVAEPEMPENQLIRQILRSTARKFGVRVTDLKGPSRRKNTAMARAVSMFLIREFTPLSLCEIGRLYRNRDHTTVRHACKKVAIRLNDQDTLELIQSICAAVGVRTRTSWFNGDTQCA